MERVVSYLSTGQENTLESWIRNCKAVFGPGSAPVKFLEKKAAESPNGINEPVVGDEGQLLIVLGKMFADEVKMSER